MEGVTCFKQYKRMCKSIDSCSNCPMYTIKVKSNCALSCETYCFQYPENAIHVVEQWAKEHPQKTIMDDFFEKYPNAPKDDNGTPMICPHNIGLPSNNNENDGCDLNCISCWSYTMEDYE